MKKFKNFLLNMLLVLISTLFILFVAEIFIRVFYNQMSYIANMYPRDMYDYNSPTYLKPGFEGQFPKSEISGKIRINSKGLRDFERPYSKNNAKRILGLGDSFVFGHGVEFENTFLYLLEEGLQSFYGQHIEIVKVGTPGIGPQKYLSILKNEGIKYSPDVTLVCFFIGNDINDIKLNHAKEKNNSKEMLYFEAENFSYKTKKDSEKNFIKLKTFLRKNIHLYSFIVDRVKTAPFFRKILKHYSISKDISGSYVIDILKKEYNEEYLTKWEEAFNILSEIKTLSDELVVVLIPTREQVYPDRLEKAVRQLGYNIDDIDIMHPNNKLINFCQLNEIRYIDLLPHFMESAKTQMLYFDIDPHFNAQGNKLAAEVLSKELQKDLQTIINKDGNH